MKMMQQNIQIDFTMQTIDLRQVHPEQFIF